MKMDMDGGGVSLPRSAVEDEIFWRGGDMYWYISSPVRFIPEVLSR